jgi:beta-alanine degradation protein BauB
LWTTAWLPRPVYREKKCVGENMNNKQAIPIVQVDTVQLRVTEWRFAPGAATGYHRHAYDYVVVPVVDGELELIGPDGVRSRAQLVQGKSYFRNAGVEHDVVNVGSGTMSFVEIELKGTGDRQRSPSREVR